MVERYMGRKNRKKRKYTTDTDDLQALQELNIGESYFCPKCGHVLTHAYGSRTLYGRYTPGTWELCENRECGHTKFIANGDSTDYESKTHGGAYYSYGGYDDVWQGDWTRYQACTHWRSPVKVGKFDKLTISASMDVPKQDDSPDPELGVYLSQGWLALSDIWTVGLKTEGANYPAVFSDWQDYGPHAMTTFERLIEVVVTGLEMDMRVDIGCAGGHGRSGTLLAGIIAKVEGLGAAEAIKAARERHCKKACETVSQEVMVYKLCGEEPPEYMTKAASKNGELHTLWRYRDHDSIYVTSPWRDTDARYLL